jgi:tartrate dehydrogenase/decarboxylase/D-malate dehydrogenase
MWAAALMLEHLGQAGAAAALISAFEATLASGVRTPDLGGTAATTDFTTAVVDTIRSRATDS